MAAIAFNRAAIPGACASTIRAACASQNLIGWVSTLARPFRIKSANHRSSDARPCCTSSSRLPDRFARVAGALALDWRFVALGAFSEPLSDPVRRRGFGHGGGRARRQEQQGQGRACTGTYGLGRCIWSRCPRDSHACGTPHSPGTSPQSAVSLRPRPCQWSEDRASGQRWPTGNRVRAWRSVRRRAASVGGYLTLRTGVPIIGSGLTAQNAVRLTCFEQRQSDYNKAIVAL